MTAAEERAGVLRDRAERWRSEGLIGEGTLQAIRQVLVTEWRTHGAIVQIVFFVLATIGVLSFYGLCAALHIPAKGLITGIVSVALAEYLIRIRKWGATGVEAALWVGGLFAMITELPRSGTPESLLVIAAAPAIAGARVRNPALGLLAAVIVMFWVERRFDAGVVFAIVVSAAALIALTREWSRPSTEWLYVMLAVVMPCAGGFMADREWRTVTLALYLALAALAALLAVTRRHHAMFAVAAIGAAGSIAVFAQIVGARVEIVLAISGSALLGLAWLATFALRDRAEGFVLTPVSMSSADEVLEIGAAVVAAGQASSAPPAQPETRPGGEGGFGGAGASGDY